MQTISNAALWHLITEVRLKWGGGGPSEEGRKFPMLLVPHLPLVGEKACSVSLANFNTDALEGMMTL